MTLRREQPVKLELLTSYTNSTLWMNNLELHARLEGVWGYCDPDAPDEDTPELHEPEKPHVSTVRPDATSIVDLGESDFAELSSIVDQYWKQMRAYEKIQDGLRIIFELIKSHVDHHHLTLIKHAKTPREQLAILSVEFKKHHLESMQPEWERIQDLARGAEVQELFERWKDLFANCAEYIDKDVRKEDAFWDCLEPATGASSSTTLHSQYWIASRYWVRDLEYVDRVARAAQLREQASKDWDSIVSRFPADGSGPSEATECATPSSCPVEVGNTPPHVSSSESLKGQRGTEGNFPVLNSEYRGGDVGPCTWVGNGFGGD
jgi:hypothetical protein